MCYLTFKEARALTASGQYRRMAVSRELLSDFITPITALRVLWARSRHCFLLESAADSAGWGRYTFLGFDPTLEITCKDGLLRVGETEMRVEHPGPVLRQILREHKSPREPGLPPFTGGLVGYFAYDYLKYAEPPLNLDAEDREQFQDMDLMLFEQVVCFDNYRQKIILIANADAENLDESYLIACGQLEQTTALLKYGRPMEHRPGRLTTPLTPLFDLPAYKAMVERGKAYIREGDIFQVVLSNRLEAGFEGSLLDAYRVLRSTTPLPLPVLFHQREHGAGRAQHAGGPGPQRPGQNQQVWHDGVHITSSRPISPFNTWSCFLVDRDTWYYHFSGRMGRSSSRHLA